MLLHSDADGSFFQVLEGEPEAIDRLLSKLSADKRHSHLTIIVRFEFLTDAMARTSRELIARHTNGTFPTANWPKSSQHSSFS
jgi:hypothetical protein